MLRRLGRLFFDALVPAGLTALFRWFERGQFALLPVNPGIERDWWHLAFLLSVLAALVAGSTFTGERMRFGMEGFLSAAFMVLLMAVPFIVGRYNLHLRLRPEYFGVVTIGAYLVFHLFIGILFGGAWSVLLNKFREQPFITA